MCNFNRLYVTSLGNFLLQFDRSKALIRFDKNYLKYKIKDNIQTNELFESVYCNYFKSNSEKVALLYAKTK